MDNDLVESISSLKASLQTLQLPGDFGKAEPELLNSLKARLNLPRRYCEFLAESDPSEVESATPAERIQLFGSRELELEQTDFAFDENGQLLSAPRRNGWRPSWIIVGRSGLLGDPYFLDVSSVDAEGDCPVYTAMSGTDTWQAKLCASSFVTFLKIQAVAMSVADDFDLDDYDPDNERVFREASGHRIREVDPAAFKAGHWT